MRLSLAALGILAAPTLVACAASPDPTPDSTANPSSAAAVVEVERSTGPGENTQNSAVAARVVRVKQGSVDDSALAIAGVGADVGSTPGCIVPADATALAQGRSIELLDVGQVVLSADTRNTTLNQRLMPDPAGMVSGVFYSSRSADSFVPGSKVAVRSMGGPDLPDGFLANVSAPHDLTDVRVSPLNEGLDVTWDTTDADAHDTVYADLLSPAPRVILRCVAGDSGRLLIPAAAIPGIDDGQLAVHRLHKESFKAKGIEPGEVRFDVAKVITFRR
jgi:hypothetical protein